MKILTNLALALLCLLCSFPTFAQTGSSDCEHPDFAALEDIFFATGGENWDRSDGWMETCEPCLWYGVRCDANNRVSALALSGNGLVGNLPAALGDLPFLGQLTMADNALTGGIPAELLTLELYGLSLSNNQLSGPLPANLGDLEYLEMLRLDGNDFSGELPASLASLGKLRQLYLNDNEFTGSFPAGVGITNSLTVIYAQNNNLTGCLPEDLRINCGSSNYKFEGNGGLPWSGDFEQFCDTDLIEDQIGAPCDDGDPNTFDEVINENCDCGPQPDGLTSNDAENTAIDQSGNMDEEDSATGTATGNLSRHVFPAVSTLARDMSVFPNPASGNQLNVSLPGNEGTANLRLLSITGSVRSERTFDGPSVQLNLPNLEAGLYLVEAVADGVRTVRRVRVE